MLVDLGWFKTDVFEVELRCFYIHDAQCLKISPKSLRDLHVFRYEYFPKWKKIETFSSDFQTQWIVLIKAQILCCTHIDENNNRQRKSLRLQMCDVRSAIFEDNKVCTYQSSNLHIHTYSPSLPSIKATHFYMEASVLNQGQKW